MKDKLIICIGGSLVDETVFCKSDPIRGTSNPSDIIKSPGGVVRNIAHHLSLLQHHVELISVFGNDDEGKWLMNACRNAGIGLNHSAIVDGNTGRFIAVLDLKGELFIGTVMNDLEPKINLELLKTKSDLLLQSELIVTDTNMDPMSIQWLINFCSNNNLKLIVEPVSIPKAGKLATMQLDNLFLLTPNEVELSAIQPVGSGPDQTSLINDLKGRGVKKIWLRLGAKGSLFFDVDQQFQLPAPQIIVRDSTGAGDAALAGWIHGYLIGATALNAILIGHTLAGMVLEQSGAILNHLTRELLSHQTNIYFPSYDTKIKS